MTSAIHPLNSLLAFWRRLTSISAKNQSPVFGLQPDQCSASSSSDIARNCAAVKLGLDDIDGFLDEVEERMRQAPNWSHGRVQDLTPLGHLVAVDVPRMVDLLRRIGHGQR